MNLIILDFESNQPYDSKHALKQPIYLHGEIVQIGAVKFDENHHILDTFKILVTPKYYPKMLKKISKLTGIKNSDLQYGFPFPVAFKHFKNWCGPDFAFLTWGPDDIGILRENMLLHRLDTDWIPKAYDLQVIFDDQIAGKNRQTSLTDAVQMVGENALEAHDALNDARNTARVCLHLDINRGLSEYKERGWSGDHQVPLGSGKAHSKTYGSYAEALEDAELTDFYCPICGSPAVCGEFIRQNTDKFICRCTCEDGHELFVRLKFRRQPDRRLSVSRIIYDLNAENESYYLRLKHERDDARAAYLRYIAEAG